MNRYLLTSSFLVSVATCTAVSAQERLTVAVYGGNWGAALQQCIIDPFTQKSGVKVTPEPGISSITLAKLRQQKGKPTLDVVWMDAGPSDIAAAEGLLAPLDPARIPGISNVIDQAVHKGADGKIYSLGTGFYSLGLVYNTKEVKTAPTSWSDLWLPAYEKRVTVPSPANAMGVPFFTVINELKGGSSGNYNPAVEALKALKVSSFFDTSGAATNSFQSGEVVIGAHDAPSTWNMIDAGVPLRFVIPKEGAPSGENRIHIVSGTPKMKDAEALISEAATPEASTCLAKKIFVGPTVKGVKLPPEVEQRLPWGAGGSIKNLVLFDWNKLNAERSAITDIFNRSVAGRP